ncbi:MAG: cation-transporting P-type ATPase [Nitrososphaerota archaeon]|nr:cation-transporting P-type ATPase [Nitrososphaerota archaeon]
MKEELQGTQWETLTNETALRKLNSTTEGLSNEEVSKRLTIFGKNKLPEVKKDSIIKRFLMQFNNSLIYVLIGAAILTALMSHWLDTGVILGVIIINAIMGCIQEDKAQKALDSIKNLLSLKASVIRNGKRQEITADGLVPGDIVLMKAGDKVPADIRLINVSHFEVDESSLTGESMTASKTIHPVEIGTVLGERESMAYAGTIVRTGEAIGVVVSTATDTEVGKIDTMLSETKTTDTPLMKKINKLGKTLSIFILSCSIFLIIYAIAVTATPWGEAILAVIGLAVGAIPEGLPAVITITLAIGVQRMAKKNAIIRRLPSVETLGSVTVICSDKTGTLTKNEMTATNIYTSNGDFSISGLGYSPEGKITFKDTQTNFEHPLLYRLIQSSYLCNDSDVCLTETTWIPHGAPTEAALKTLARKAGYNNTNAVKIDDIPFDSQYKYRAALRDIDGKRILFVNGAPEKLIQICTYQTTDIETKTIDREFWEAKIEEAASRGQRLIGCAYTEVNCDKNNINHSDLNGKMIFTGIVGIIDPPRPEAIESIRVCKNAGIRVKMITGDHVLTAREIARQMGLTNNSRVINGAEIEKMDNQQIREDALNCDIFARTSPEHKLRIVKALQEQGEVVAMTGDGVNDAPALKTADIGVAMGIKGTEVTKDSAVMVLADDNFASIVSAVEEGRTIHDNIKKSLLFILPTSGANALVIVAAILFNFTLPMTPVQILWVNMVTAITLALSLAFEPAEQNIMKRAPRNPKESLISGYFLFRIILASAIVTALTIFFFSHYNNNGADLAYARTVAINMLVFGEMFYLFNCRNIHNSIFSKGFLRNKVPFIVSGILLLIQIVFTYLPFMQQLFNTAPLLLIDWLYLLAGGAIILLVVELEKILSRKIIKIK